MQHKAFPVRTCIACGRKAPKMELLRMVLRKGRPVFDRRQCLPGRGAYVCPTGPCREMLAHSGARPFSHAFRKKVIFDGVSGLWEIGLSDVSGEVKATR